MDLSLDDLRIIETLVLKQGSIRTNECWLKWFNKNIIYVYTSSRDPKRFSYISNKTVKKLYAMGLLTKRYWRDDDFPWYSDYTIWEVYRPRLQRYECFKELIIQDALGTV